MRLLTGEEVNYDGQLVHLDGGRLDFKPICPRVRVYVASNGELGLALAGQIADGAVMQGAVAGRTIDWMITNVSRGAKKAGRDLSAVDIVSRVNLCISEDGKAAKDVMRSGLARSLVATQPEFPTFRIAGLPVTDEMRERVKTIGFTYDPEKLAPVANLIPDEYVDGLTLAGNVEHIRAGCAPACAVRHHAYRGVSNRVGWRRRADD